MLADVVAMVGHENNDGVMRFAALLERGEDPSYGNTGVIVAGKQHRRVFDWTRGYDFASPTYEQTLLNYRARELEFRIFDLPSRYNRLVFFAVDEPSLASAQILHYAGNYHLPSLVQRAKHDILWRLPAETSA